MNPVEIRLQGVHKTFRDGTQALQPIDLKIEAGEVLVLLGPSGCGKSTLLRMIGGLELPMGGAVWIGERDITYLPTEKREIGFVFQQYALFPTMTVAENIAFGMKLRKYGKQEREKKTTELLEMMNLTELKDRKSAQLSGGQQQRVAIARALAIEPKVLLMDEPLTALDAKLKEHLRIELAQLFRRLKITTVYVTHDQVEAMAIADRIAVMNKGVIEQIGTAKEIYHRPHSSFVAQFVGQVNRLKGKITDGADGYLVDFGFYRIPYHGENASSTEIEAYIRPEDVFLDEQSGFTAHVRDVIFLGERNRVIVETEGQKLFMDVPNDTLLHDGEQVQLQVHQNKVIYA
ncbi:ABC transporter ATP-binding protein [Aneurinibacillus migulanus]|uniref:Putative spermidine/putrescine transport system ATP-binding protein n=1 Tax=Aneurinibacillus migulanus TaxID=47500 RepID=A0A0D1XW92_ANEMI|nr:ABC transporter ATP-binding protein [Aneurinibacillus migulanus]KIV58481.1 spermidine/putrescine ABC transporter [Aneurinibacillus migulanus]KON90877.1 spermidine/putrescine ABC transporter [Aneurinibacillus migulanus]MED0890721.1 ABC transporter ATP-binding protein [Aneurinibacillus migulanus]MED1617099.1 ABC transporter ATP-binding protein [Aneurinibacillus migulanus]SDJ22524.1 putative spermidine/putrescine transport system ATP-binding protein [Aneurinibacillus migulanus]